MIIREMIMTKIYTLKEMTLIKIHKTKTIKMGIQLNKLWILN